MDIGLTSTAHEKSFNTNFLDITSNYCLTKTAACLILTGIEMRAAC